MFSYNYDRIFKKYKYELNKCCIDHTCKYYRCKNDITCNHTCNLEHCHALKIGKNYCINHKCQLCDDLIMGEDEKAGVSENSKKNTKPLICKKHKCKVADCNKTDYQLKRLDGYCDFHYELNRQ